jgi:phage gp16-like protein
MRPPRIAPISPANKRARDIRMIHVAQRSLGLSRDEYESILSGLFGHGCTSSSGLDAAQREKLIAHFKKCGFKVTIKASKAHQFNQTDRDDLSKQALKIKALWAMLANAGVVKNKTDHALNSYIQRQTDVAHLKWLNPAQMSRVIESLKAWLARSGHPCQQKPSELSHAEIRHS